MSEKAIPQAQGDVLFLEVDAVPSGCTEAKRDERNQLVVAHSETGHHHVVDTAGARLWNVPGDPLTSYLETPTVPGFGAGSFAPAIEVRHLRGFDTHGTLKLPGEGRVWEVRRQRTPAGKVVAD